MNEDIPALIEQLLEQRERLDALKKQSPELKEALAVQERYDGLLHDLWKRCAPQPAVVPMPYPVQVPVVPPWTWVPGYGYPELYPPYKIICGNGTVWQHSKSDLEAAADGH